MAGPGSENKAATRAAGSVRSLGEDEKVRERQPHDRRNKEDESDMTTIPLRQWKGADSSRSNNNNSHFHCDIG
jgi:hypothetical protein